MLLLAYDTSGREGGIALANCRQNACEILEEVAVSGGTFSAQLVPQTAEILRRHGFTPAHIEAFAVASGPGSFTGLRVGLAAIKGLAEVLHKPIAAVSVLQAMVWQQREQPAIAALDASRKEAYVGAYRDNGRTLIHEKLLPQSELAALCAQNPATLVVACDDSILALVPGAKRIARPRPSDFARIGWTKLQAGETVSVDDLDANYIRRSDAEIFSAPPPQRSAT